MLFSTLSRWVCAVVLVGIATLLLPTTTSQFTVGAHAALPPLSSRDKLIYSPHVFTGKVWSCEEKISENTNNPNGEWSNIHTRCVVEVERVYQTSTKTRSAIAGLQGDDEDVDETLLASTLVYILFWKMGKRPRGWVGDTGLTTASPKEGFSYSFHTHYLGSTPMERTMYQSTFPYEKMDRDSDNTPGSKTRVVSDHSYNVLVPNGLGDLDELDPQRADRERLTVLSRRLKEEEESGRLEAKEVQDSAAMEESIKRAKKTPGNPVQGGDALRYESHNKARKKKTSGGDVSEQDMDDENEDF